MIKTDSTSPDIHRYLYSPDLLSYYPMTQIPVLRKKIFWSVNHPRVNPKIYRDKCFPQFSRTTLVRILPKDVIMDTRHPELLLFNPTLKESTLFMGWLIHGIFNPFDLNDVVQSINPRNFFSQELWLSPVTEPADHNWLQTRYAVTIVSW